MHHGYQNSLEQTILSSSPLELVRLLYRGALDAISDARKELAGGDPFIRSAKVTKAVDILAELAVSLNLENGVEVGRQLAGLYEYLINLVQMAHTRQSDAQFAEAECLLSTLLEGWNGCQEINIAIPEEPETGRLCYSSVG